MLEKMRNQVYDTDYTKVIRQGGAPVVDWQKVAPADTRGWFDRFIDFFLQIHRKDGVIKEPEKHTNLQGNSLDEQLKSLLALPDEQYDENLLTPQIRKYVMDVEKEYVSTLQDYKTHISPSYREVQPGQFSVSWILGKTYYATSYPSYIDFLWTREMLNYFAKWDMSWFVYPAEDTVILSMLKRRSTQLKAEISTAVQKGITYDTEIDIEHRDVEDIRQKLATREERYFETSFYTTIYEHDAEKLREESKKFEQKIGGYGVRMKQATQRMDEGQVATMPLCIDDLNIPRSMVSTSLGGSFPFISNDLIENSGILYGLNLHTWSLVIFDRFANRLPNANSIILATSGAWKSFSVKLEILRYLLLGIEVIVIDPENEYKTLTEKVGGSYINISINSQNHINPFDLPPKIEDVEYGKGDLLRSQILNLIWLMHVLLWGMTPAEEALIDKALQATYALKEITMDMDDTTGKTYPIMEDLLHVLEGMAWGDDMALKLSKYVTGTFAKLFNSPTNIDLNTQLTTFSIRDIEDALKTPAMFNVLNYIWTKVRSQKKKRLLVIDEAWIMMQSEVASSFLYQLVKRARKYGLGITTITQDVEDFVNSKYGKPIVSNASLQLLLKQSTSSIKALEAAFGLSEAEKQKLVAANIGEGLFFAGNQHVAVKILASPDEKDFINTTIA